MISFTDLGFLFRFLPLMLLAYYLTPYRHRTLTLLIGSVAFYALGQFRFLPVLLVATILNYLMAEGCYRRDRLFLLGSVGLDVGILVVFKLLGRTFGSSFLPVGISFYLFRMISYQADLYRGKETARPNITDTAAYFTFFPQVTMGPVMRFAGMKSCVATVKLSLTGILKQIEEGLHFFCLGFAFKTLIADRLSSAWAQISQIGYESISTPLAWIGVVCYSLNLYYDFWGYSLMAAGLAMMLGYSFVENFHHPYAAVSAAEYYRRWHMTLGAFFRDYVYIPLGGSRQGTAKTVRNLAVVWLLTGFWHGASLNFLVWGMLLCGMIVWERFVLKRLPERAGNILGRFHVLVLIPLTWVVFAITDFQALQAYFLRLFPVAGTPEIVNAADYTAILSGAGICFLAGLVFLIPAVYDRLVLHRRHPAVTVLLFAAFWGSVYQVARTEGNPFLYLNF